MKTKKIMSTIFILGVIFLSAFCAPHAIPNYVEGVPKYDARGEVHATTIQKGYNHEYSNIFSPNGSLEIANFSFYIALWAVLCYAAVFVFGKEKS